MSITYDELATKAQPGDLLLFKGNDFISKTVCMIEMLETDVTNSSTCSICSHVGIVVNAEALPNVKQLKPDRLYILESTCTLPYISAQIPDERLHKCRMGVQIRDLELVIKSYLKVENACVFWCKLQDNPWETSRDDMIAKIDHLVQEIGYRPYEYRIINLLASVFPFLRSTRMTFDVMVSDVYHILSTLHLANDKTPKDIEEQTLFCSQLVSMFYQRLGLLNLQIDPADIIPVDYIHPRDERMDDLVKKFEQPYRITIDSESNPVQ